MTDLARLARQLQPHFDRLPTVGDLTRAGGNPLERLVRRRRHAVGPRLQQLTVRGVDVCTGARVGRSLQRTRTREPRTAVLSNRPAVGAVENVLVHFDEVDGDAQQAAAFRGAHVLPMAAAREASATQRANDHVRTSGWSSSREAMR
jgi:hypothetical protein